MVVSRHETSGRPVLKCAASRLVGDCIAGMAKLPAVARSISSLRTRLTIFSLRLKQPDNSHVSAVFDDDWTNFEFFGLQRVHETLAYGLSSRGHDLGHRLVS